MAAVLEKKPPEKDALGAHTRSACAFGDTEVGLTTVSSIVVAGSGVAVGSPAEARHHPQGWNLGRGSADPGGNCCLTGHWGGMSSGVERAAKVSESHCNEKYRV